MESWRKIFVSFGFNWFFYFQAQNTALTQTNINQEIASEPQEIASEDGLRSDDAEFILHKFEALKLVNDVYAQSTFEEARQIFEEVKEENSDIPASVTFEYALVNDLLVPAREKRDLSSRFKTVVSVNCSTLSWLIRKIYPFCSDRNKRSLRSYLRGRNLTDIVAIDRISPPKVQCKFQDLSPEAQVFNPSPNDYKISPTPLIFMAVASSLGLLSSLVLICKAFCCKH